MAIETTVEKRNQKKSNPTPLGPERVLITRKELIARWGISLATLKRIESSAGLTRVCVCDRMVSYNLDQVREIEKGGR